MAGIFKAYDIRGVYPKDINEDVFYKIGVSISNHFNCKSVVIAYDMRNSSLTLMEALVKGLSTFHVKVYNLGLSSTPMLYQAACDLDVDLGIIITASHNSKEYNGMKICLKGAKPIAYGSGIEKIEEEFNKNKFLQTDNQVNIENLSEYKEKYKEKMLKYFSSLGNKKLKVVYDPGNGMGGHIDLEILNEICDLIPLYTELDGTFPNHEANPSKEENLLDLKQKVISEQADLGFAFDGDADRIGVVDDKGNMVHADIIGAFLIENFIKKNPEKLTYSFDLRSSRIISDLLKKNSKNGIQTRVGHSYIKEIMLKENSYFSLELSGHYYFWFEDKYVYDSAIRSAIEILNFLSLSTQPFSEILKKYLVYHKIEEKNFIVSDSEKVFVNLKQEFSQYKQKQIDGLTIEGKSWWANIRTSNTEPLLRLNFEAENEDDFNTYLKKITSVIQS